MYVSLEKRSLCISPSVLDFSIEFILLVHNMQFYVAFLTFRCDAGEFFVVNIKAYVKTTCSNWIKVKSYF